MNNAYIVIILCLIVIVVFAGFSIYADIINNDNTNQSHVNNNNGQESIVNADSYEAYGRENYYR